MLLETMLELLMNTEDVKAVIEEASKVLSKDDFAMFQLCANMIED